MQRKAPTRLTRALARSVLSCVGMIAPSTTTPASSTSAPLTEANGTLSSRGQAGKSSAGRLRALLVREHGALADFLLALAEFDRKRGWRELGYASLFPFLHRELRLSKAAAFFRKTAAELVQRFPDVLEPIRDGRLCLTSVVELAKVLTPENRDRVLPRFFHCSKQEARAVSAELAPDSQPVRRTVVTAVSPPTLTVVQGATPPQPQCCPGTAGVEPNGEATPPAETPSQTVRPGELHPPQSGGPDRPAGAPPRDTAEPLTADLRRLHITVSKRFLDKLEAARAVLSHSVLGATTEVILETALDLVLERDAKRKGLAGRPRRAGATPPIGSPCVPAAVRREVWKRDGGRCQWPLASGGVCGSTVRVELDHVRARGQGGRATVENMRLLCRFHNDLAARVAYGDALMDRYTGTKIGRVVDREPAGDAHGPCDSSPPRAGSG